MPASVIVGGDLLEAHLQIQRGPDPLEGVDSTSVQCGIELTGWNVGDGHAEFGEDLAGKTRDAHLQALQIIKGIDLLAEPAAHLVTGVAAREGIDAMLGKHLLHQVHAAAIVEPGVLFRGSHAERHGGKEHSAGILALPVISGGMPHLVLTGVDHVENTQGCLVFVGTVDVDQQFAVGHDLDLLGHVLDRVTENREVVRPGHGQFPLIDFLRRNRLLLYCLWGRCLFTTAEQEQAD